MKTTGTIFLVVLMIEQMVFAQGGFTYLSNLSEPSAGKLAVSSNSWFAGGFVTGTNSGGYALNSIQLGMVNAIGTPNGFQVMIYTNTPQFSSSDFRPGSSLGALIGSTDPATAGIYTYSPTSTLILSSDTYYYIVLTAGTPPLIVYNWSFVNASVYSPSDGWNGEGGLYYSHNGSSWSLFGSQFPQFAINATAVPEPGGFSLFGLGGLAFLWHRRKAGAVL